ncbi:hypothetical protein B0H11DRAFT_1931270 [Mycena galericulata]|nr:hypothetical protein B0H11DRAFT_1931270 [Mycena galericulata]
MLVIRCAKSSLRITSHYSPVSAVLRWLPDRHLQLGVTAHLSTRPRNRLKSDSRQDLIDFSRQPPLDHSPHFVPPADPSISIRLHTHIVVLVVSDGSNTFASTDGRAFLVNSLQCLPKPLIRARSSQASFRNFKRRDYYILNSRSARALKFNLVLLLPALQVLRVGSAEDHDDLHSGLCSLPSATTRRRLDIQRKGAERLTRGSGVWSQMVLASGSQTTSLSFPPFLVPNP